MTIDLNGSSAGKRSSFGQARLNGVRAGSFGVIVAVSSRAPLPRFRKSHGHAIGRPAGCFTHHESEPIIAKAGYGRVGMAGKRGDYS
jgi:hypothetical protein